MNEKMRRVSLSDDAERRKQCVPTRSMATRGMRVLGRWWDCAAMVPPCIVPLCVLAMLALSVGCNRNTGPARYDVSGSITYDGKPVPAGSIIFAPDTSKGNDGPGASAEIKDGVYRTRANQGTVGGPHVATVSGFDGVPYQNGPVTNPMGKALFTNVQISVDLPKQTTTQDIVVPAQNAR